MCRSDVGVAGLERGGRRRPRSFARRQRAAGDGGGDAECREDDHRRRFETGRDFGAAKESGTEIGTETPQRDPRERVPGCDTGDRTGSAEQGGFGNHHAHEPPARQAERAQQRQLRAAARKRERLRGEHQHATREECHQRQHVEVDAVGPRQARRRGRAFGRWRNDDARRQHRLHAPGQCIDVGARRSAQIDARQAAVRAEQVLRSGDVHDGIARTARARARDAGDAQRYRRAAGEHSDRVAIADAERGRCGGAREQRVAAQRVETITRAGHERRIDLERAKHVDADDRQRLAAGGDDRRDFDDRARDRDAVEARELRIKRLVETGAWSADLQVGLPGKRRESGREFVHRGAIDERDRIAERDARGDREHGKERASACERRCTARNGACDCERRGRHVRGGLRARASWPDDSIDIRVACRSEPVRREAIHDVGGRSGRARMRRQDARGAVRPDRIAQQRDHLPGALGIEIAGGLVGEHERRAVHERACDRDTLQLAP